MRNLRGITATPAVTSGRATNISFNSNLKFLLSHLSYLSAIPATEMSRMTGGKLIHPLLLLLLSAGVISGGAASGGAGEGDALREQEHGERGE